MADNFTMRVRQGDTYLLSLTYRDSDQDPIDVTGYTYEWRVTVGEVSDLFTTSPEIVIADPTNGGIALKLDASKTETYITARGRFFLRVTSPAPVITTLLEGDVEVDFNE